MEKRLGNRTEVALLELARLLGGKPRRMRRAARTLAQVAFSSERKRMTTAALPPGRDLALCAGAVFLGQGAGWRGISGGELSTCLLPGLPRARPPPASHRPLPRHPDAQRCARLDEGQRLVRIYSKGAPEIILERCAWALGPDGERRRLGPADHAALLKQFSGSGQR